MAEPQGGGGAGRRAGLPDGVRACRGPRASRGARLRRDPPQDSSGPARPRTGPRAGCREWRHHGSEPSMSTIHVGQPTNRVDGRAKVTGEARYAAEYDVPDLAYGHVVSSEVARGTIESIDARAALALPGVL